MFCRGLQQWLAATASFSISWGHMCSLRTGTVSFFLADPWSCIGRGLLLHCCLGAFLAQVLELLDALVTTLFGLLPPSRPHSTDLKIMLRAHAPHHHHPPTYAHKHRSTTHMHAQVYAHTPCTRSWAARRYAHKKNQGSTQPSKQGRRAAMHHCKRQEHTKASKKARR